MRTLTLALHQASGQSAKSERQHAKEDAPKWKPATKDTQAPERLGDYKVFYLLSDGSIQFETRDGERFLVDEASTPELFQTVKRDHDQLAAINQSGDDGYGTLADDAEPPGKLGDYRAIGAPGEIADGVIRYEMQGGEKIVVAERANPELFKAVKQAYETLSGVNDSEAKGYRRAGRDEALPPYAGTQVGPPEEVGPNVIRYEHNGEKVVVARDDNPALYDHVSGLYSLYSDDDQREAIDIAMEDGAKVADAKSEAPGFNDYKKFHWQNDARDDVIQYTTHDGENVVVSRELSPGLFDEVSSAQQTWATIHDNEGQGYALAGGNDYLENETLMIGPPGEVGDGLIRYETEDGEKFIVSEELSPQLYQELTDRYSDLTSDHVDDIRDDYDLPMLDDLDILGMDTGVPMDDEDDDSPTLSVQELATQDLIEQYRDGVENGDIAEDDPRAQLVRAMEAQAAYYNGRGITGYAEGPGFFGGTWREFDDEQTMLTGADMHSIIDGPALQERLGELFGDETIQKDYAASMENALDRIDTGKRDEIKSQLVDTLKSSEFTEYLGALRDAGYGEEASGEINRLLSALNVLDPKAGEEAAQYLQVNALTSDLNELVGDPEKIEQPIKNKAAGDLFTLVKSILSETAGVPRQLVNSVENFIKEFGGDAKMTEVTKAIESLQDKFKNNEVITADDIKNAVDKPYIPLEDRGKIAGFLVNLNNTGLLGSVGGALSLVSAIYTMVEGSDALAKSDLARLGVARDFINFLSMAPQFTKLFDKGMSLLGKNGVADALGVSKTLKENLGKDWIPSFDKPKTNPIVYVPGIDNMPKLPEVPTGVADEIAREGNKIADDILSRETPTDLPNNPANTPPTSGGNGTNPSNNVDKISTLMDDLAKAKGLDKVPGSSGTRIAGSVVKTLGALSDGAGGIADIVLGAFSIDRSIKAGSDAGIAMGSLQVVGGAMGLAAGGIGIAGLFGSVGAAAAFTGPLFVGALILGGIAAIVGIFVNHDKKQDATEKENDWYRQLADDGLLQENWADKVEYLHYSIYEYGDREAPDDKSLFDYQKDEWEHFDETPQENGSSTNRLDEDLHLDPALDGFGADFYDEHSDVLDTVRDRWDDWNGSDAITSRDDLEKYVKDEGRSQEERDAAQFLLDNGAFFSLLDTRAKDDGEDGKISTGDLDTWLKEIGKAS